MPTFNDRPIASIGDDALNFADYGPVLESILTTGDTPLTVGIFGAWGSGKSSLMQMLRQEIEAQQRFSLRTVWFTAWKYDRQEALWRALILRVLEAMYPREPGEGPREERPLLHAPEGSREQRLTETLDRLSEAVYESVDWEDVGPRNIKWWQLIGNVGEASADVVATLASAGAWPKIKEMLGGDGPPVQEVRAAAEAISKSVIRQQQRQLKHMEAFEARFAEAIRLLGRDNARLIVFIDDLDRCLPEKAVEVLEAIKLFLEVEGAVFVLGMDPEIIRRGIEARYGGLFSRAMAADVDLPIGGDVYLQKIVQIPFHLPVLMPEDVGRFIETLGAGLGRRTRESFARGLHRNPRQVKRALNIFQLLKEVAEARIARKVMPEEAIAWPLLAKTVVIQTQYPHLYQQWRLRPTLLISLEQLYEQRQAPQGRAHGVVQSPQAAEALGSGVVTETSGADGILESYLSDTADNIYLREMLTYPASDDGGEGTDRARFGGLRREEVERYVRLAGSVTVATEVKEVGKIALSLEEFVSGDVARVQEAVALLQEREDESLTDAYRRRLRSVLQDPSRSRRERVSAGDSLMHLGDPRFRKDAWYLPREPQLGFVHVPAGPVTVGSDVTRDDWARDDEQPLFDVDAPEFYIARYPVTVAQFRAYLEDAGLEPRDADSLKGAPNQPVVWVYWQEAMDYARWLTEKLREWQETPETLQRLLLDEGWEVCLPSEVQWARAARGRDGRLYPWGDTFETDRANTRETGLGRPSAAGAFPRGASPFGALDMSGNVWEWTSSEYRPYAERWQQAVSAWSDAQEHPVLRGGSFHNDSHAARCATRLGLDRHSRDLSLGFRVALAPGTGGPVVDEDEF